MLLSFEYVLQCYPKNGFQLSADVGEKKWKSNDSLLIWLGNICPISRDQSSRNKILGKIYVSG